MRLRKFISACTYQDIPVHRLARAYTHTSVKFGTKMKADRLLTCQFVEIITVIHLKSYAGFKAQDCQSYLSENIYIPLRSDGMGKKNLK